MAPEKPKCFSCPNVGLEVTETFLKHLAASDPEAEHIVIWDGAGFHQKAGRHALPDRVHIIQLPPYSPELNPALVSVRESQEISPERPFLLIA